MPRIAPSVRFPLGPEPDAWLRERVRLEHPGDTTGGRFVLYWMCTALRSRDNPCLDAARRAAAKRDLPLLVYQGLTHRAWYASDRTHAFILEGAADVAEDLAAQGVRHVLHIERDAREHGALARLAADAAMVFTEDFPVGDLPRWRAALARACGRPIYAVDAACALPMRLVDRAYERAFAFREATAESRRARLDTEAPNAPSVPQWEGALPFTPVDARSVDLAETLALMRIDHGVGPVDGLRGGARAAQAHWSRWRDAELRSYHARRTDAADPRGASALSPYLHFGMIAPWRVAAEALALGGPGAEKFLDELLTWRELAWCFCAHRTDYGDVTALPAWARQTLADTADRRTQRPTLDAIERAETGDALFDLAQRTLRTRGWLHNNLRMTWGRILAAWFRDPAEGLRVITDLNHRYALDGRDPASYGGILWCYGQFDRAQGDHGGPLGAITARDGAAHLRRLDVPAYRGFHRLDAAPRAGCVVVGAGIAGLMAARTLHDQGIAVTVLDKGRAPGGRVGTRRVDGASFDHGAQFFTARDPRFARHVAAWEDTGVVRRWFDETLRGAPGMSALPRFLAAGIAVRCDVTVTAITRTATGYAVHTADGAVFEAPAMIVTAPVPQSLALLDAGGVALDPSIRARLDAVTYTRCLAGLFASPWPVSLPAHGVARVEGETLAWLASNAVKGVSEADALTAHATPAFSLARWGDDDAGVLDALGAEVAQYTGSLPRPVSLKRWRYARPEVFLDGPAVVNDGGCLVVTGDAFHPDGGRVEAAALAGVAAAAAVRDALSRHPAE